MEDIGLAMQRNLKLKLISHTSHSYFFFSLCKDVEVTMKKLKTRHPIFVIKHKDYDLIISQFFLNLVKFNQKYKLNGIFSTIIPP